MASLELLQSSPFKDLEAGKRLTLSFGGLYIVDTTLSSKARLVWESEQSHPRYYVPVSTLHPDVKGKLGITSNGHEEKSRKAISIAAVEQLDLKGASSAAIVEELKIGSKSTRWVRFLSGPYKDYIRYEANELDAWFEDGAIAVAIKNPYKRIDTKTIAAHVVVKVDGELVAEANAATVLHETGLKPTFYLPATSIKDWGSIEKSDLRTACPYKGEAWYLSLKGKDAKAWDNLIWYYQYPTHESAAVEGLVSFYNKQGVEITVDGVRI